ncbi:flavin monoamine oxidase family protein [Halioxenophilus sp. WMMB6]|uniref:flavin monoamine oxidase family protein n=1 Tax=Halioxenophilus sp. WMMB6 TaxID=3073815 RepID=UPI00295EA687|nr:FAD-dependent oxidoreductase [Halioxenophilus sp. WMMB6]
MWDIAIIGGGLSGLVLTYRLTQKYGDAWAKEKLRLYEARPRLGGRISGVNAHSDQDFMLDLGPSWLWPDSQPAINRLLAELQLTILPQWQNGHALYQAQRQVAPQRFIERLAYAGAFRIEGGSSQLIDALIARCPRECLQAGLPLTTLSDANDHVELQFASTTGAHTETAKSVVLTLPPRLIQHSLQFNPVLAAPLAKALADTPTWMAGHAKIAAVYSEPFWRGQGLSGMALANFPGAALAEVFDLCGGHGQPAVLGGFMALPYAAREEWRDDLQALVIEQLTRLFGAAAANPLSLHIQDWGAEAYTAAPADWQPPSYHPEYGHPWLAMDHWFDKLFFCGSETAASGGGYMEGAVVAAERVAREWGIMERDCRQDKGVEAG